MTSGGVQRTRQQMRTTHRLGHDSRLSDDHRGLRRRPGQARANSSGYLAGLLPGRKWLEMPFISSAIYAGPLVKALRGADASRLSGLKDLMHIAERAMEMVLESPRS
jgi:hypothetical protein